MDRPLLVIHFVLGLLLEILPLALLLVIRLLALIGSHLLGYCVGGLNAKELDSLI